MNSSLSTKSLMSMTFGSRYTAKFQTSARIGSLSLQSMWRNIKMSLHDGLVLLFIYVGTIAAGALIEWAEKKLKKRS